MAGCAGCAERGDGWGPTSAVDVPSLQLLAKGYACVAQESLIGVDITPASGADGKPWTNCQP